MFRALARPAAVLAGTAALIVGGAAAAAAHHCYVPTPSTHGPQSANWFFLTVEEGAALIGGFATECGAQREAGYAAVKAAGLPASIKIFEKKTIGENSANPNLADGKGLEHFGAGSTTADDAVATYVQAASAITCG